MNKRLSKQPLNQSTPQRKAIKSQPPGFKEKIENWCRSHRIWIIAMIIMVSILFRIVYFVQINNTHFINQHIWSESDMSFFDYWAKAIAKGDILSSNIHQPEHSWMQWVTDQYFKDHPDELAFFKTKIGPDTLKNTPSKLLWKQWYGEKTFQQEPLYPYFVALNYTLFGYNVRWIFLWQMLLGVVTNLLVYLVTRRYFGDLAAAIAGIFIVFFGPLLFFELVLLRSSLAVFFGIFATYLIGTAMRKKTFIWWIIAGIGCGLALLVHAFFMLFIIGTIVFLLFIFRKERKNEIRSAGGIIIGVILVLTPVMIRNATLGAPVMSLSNTGTLSFITMNNGHFVSFIGWGIDTKILSEIMAESKGQLIKSIIPTLKTHKSVGSYLTQLWDKLHASFSWYEIPNNVNFYFYREYASVLFITFISFLFLSPLALTGIFLALYKKINAWPLYLMFLVFMFPMLAFMVLSRYRIILAVVLIPFAALTIAELLSSWKGWKNYLILISLGILGYWASTPGTDKVAKITSNDYNSVLAIHYNDPLQEAIDHQKWNSIVNLLSDFITRYEPEKIKKIKPFYKCNEPVESGIFIYFSDMHGNLAHALELSGDSKSAIIERDIADKLKTAANR